jgi:hypothetical protein
MGTSLSAHAEMGEEAVRNYAQAHARALGGLQDAGLEGLDVRPSGLTFKYGKEEEQDPFNGMVVMSSSNNVDAPAPGITCKEDLEVRFSPSGDAEAERAQVATALDIAVELGLELKTNAPNPYTFPRPVSTPADGGILGELDDAANAEAEGVAQLKAMERARLLAAGLADLGGRTLGPVHSIKLGSLVTTWKGVGEGVEVTASVTVTFEML